MTLSLTTLTFLLCLDLDLDCNRGVTPCLWGWLFCPTVDHCERWELPWNWASDCRKWEQQSWVLGKWSAKVSRDPSSHPLVTIILCLFVVDSYWLLWYYLRPFLLASLILWNPFILVTLILFKAFLLVTLILWSRAPIAYWLSTKRPFLSYCAE